jgi:hypothetical protein
MSTSIALANSNFQITVRGQRICREERPAPEGGFRMFLTATLLIAAAAVVCGAVHFTGNSTIVSCLGSMPVVAPNHVLASN